MRTFGLRGIARLGRRGAVLAVVDISVAIVLVAHVAGGIASGMTPAGIADSDPMQLLGMRLADAPCPTAPLAVGAGRLVVCDHWTAVISPAGKVEVVSMYGPGNAVVEEYAGALPLGLEWGDPISAAWKALGRPNRITSVYGTPTLVYFFDKKPYGSLELRFDASQHLVRVNASLVH